MATRKKSESLRDELKQLHLTRRRRKRGVQWGGTGPQARVRDKTWEWVGSIKCVQGFWGRRGKVAVDLRFGLANISVSGMRGLGSASSSLQLACALPSWINSRRTAAARVARGKLWGGSGSSVRPCKGGHMTEGGRKQPSTTLCNKAIRTRDQASAGKKRVRQWGAQTKKFSQSLGGADRFNSQGRGVDRIGGKKELWRRDNEQHKIAGTLFSRKKQFRMQVCATRDSCSGGKI